MRAAAATNIRQKDGVAHRPHAETLDAGFFGAPIHAITLADISAHFRHEWEAVVSAARVESRRDLGGGANFHELAASQQNCVAIRR
jgi:hypothetical protein